MSRTPIITPAQILRGIKERQTCAEDANGEYQPQAGQVLQELYDVMSEPQVVAPDERGNMQKRYAQASDIAMAIFRRANGKLDAVEQATKAIEMTKTAAGPTAELIPAGEYWSSLRGRAVPRQHIYSWATSDYDTAEGDRFWVKPNLCLGIAKVPTSEGSGWMLTAWKDSKCVASLQTTHAFELMVFVDQWLDRFATGFYVEG